MYIIVHTAIIYINLYSLVRIQCKLLKIIDVNKCMKHLYDIL